jgi:anti-sigma regulatory factor (Ser/Thr protein kinase)
MTFPMSTAVATQTDHWSTAFQHEALFYAGADEFLSGTLPFLREGLEADEPMMVAVPEPRLTLLRTALERDAERVSFLDMTRIGRNPAHIIPAWAAFLEEHGRGRVPVRGIGEPIWAGRSADELVECQRHETLLNVAFAHSGSWRLLCPYDTVGLPPDVLDEARCSHPWVTDAGGPRDSSEWCRDLERMSEPFDAPLPPAPANAEMLSFDLTNIPATRALVARVARAAGLTSARTDDLVLASHELVSNSVRHGGGAGAIRVWHDNEGLVCEVSDTGRIGHPLVGRQLPDEDSVTGRGLWMANQLCDLVQIRTFSDGSVVRLRVHRR